MVERATPEAIAASMEMASFCMICLETQIPDKYRARAELLKADMLAKNENYKCSPEQLLLALFDMYGIKE